MSQARKKTTRKRSQRPNLTILQKPKVLSLTGLVLILVVAVGGFFIYQHFSASAISDLEQKSAEQGNWCMELDGRQLVPGAIIRTAPCDGRGAEQFYAIDRPDWGTDVVVIKADPDWCVHPALNSTDLSAPITLERCDPYNTSQRWHRFQPDSSFGEYRNVDASRVNGTPVCLTIPSGHTGDQLLDRVCKRYADQLWQEDSRDTTQSLADCPGSEVTASPSEAHCLGKVELERVYGWTQGTDTLNNQFTCLEDIYNRESGWNRLAQNPSSGAYGIPQALPPGKMGAEANPPTSSAAAQIRWGVGYIKAVYGTPCGAWAFWQNHGWYGPMIPAAGQEVDTAGSPDGYVGYALYPGGLQ